MDHAEYRAVDESTVTFNATSRHSSLNGVAFTDRVEQLASSSSNDELSSIQADTSWDVHNSLTGNESDMNNPTSANQPQHANFEINQPPAVALSYSWSSNISQHTQPEPLEVEFSMIGLGVQSGASGEDATDASIRALQDALSRSQLNLPRHSTDSNPWQIHIKLGVPCRSQSQTKPMSVDLSRLASVLPGGFVMLPINIVIGGLHVSGKEQNAAMCSVTACVSFQRTPSRTAVVGTQIQQHGHWATPVMEHPLCQPGLPMSIQRRAVITNPMVAVQHRADNTNSMEMLARISEEVRENRVHTSSPCVPRHGFRGPVDEIVSGLSDNEAPSTSSRNVTHRGITVNKRQLRYAQHNYADHADEKPTATDGAMVLSGKNHSTAFPVKVHEVLAELAKDSREHIMSWQPHGRSFKIHKHQEFIDLVLPQYFVMTKKSSFLRQLNLYGFNRLSVGPDKGAYYHELFLRGRRFLCRRMNRNKINGNGTRSAAKPEQEPNFYAMPEVSTDAVEDLEFASSQDDTEDSIDRADQSQSASECGSRTPEMGRNQAIANNMSFPLKLQTMLDQLEIQGNNDVISWLPHGRGFLVHQPDAFVNDLMPKYFRQTKYSSFQRQLHMYSFQRITAGRDKGAYYHVNCLRGNSQLCQQMTRTRVNGKGCRKPGNPQLEPDFYQLPTIPPAAMAAAVAISSSEDVSLVEASEHHARGSDD